MGFTSRLLSFINSTQAWYIYTALFVMLLCVITWFVYKKKPLETDVPNASLNKGEIVLMLFFADWCPHCTSALPVWTDVSNKYNNKFIHGYKMKFVTKDCSDNETDKVKRWMQEYHVKGFPTLKMIKEGETIDFDARISVDSLEKFISDMT